MGRPDALGLVAVLGLLVVSLSSGCGATLSSGAAQTKPDRELAVDVDLDGEPLTLHLALPVTATGPSAPLVVVRQRRWRLVRDCCRDVPRDRAQRASDGWLQHAGLHEHRAPAWPSAERHAPRRCAISTSSLPPAFSWGLLRTLRRC